MVKLSELQKIGKALLTPVAVLPAAALLLRLGSPDIVEFLRINTLHGPMKDILLMFFSLMNLAGKTIFDNLALLFAVGVAIGLTEGAGVAALASVVGYFVLISVFTSMTPFLNQVHILAPGTQIDMGVFAGIITGMVVAGLYKKYKDIKLPDYLQFFGGRRFVPIASAFTMLVLGIALGFIWPPIQKVIFAGGEWMTKSGSIGVFTYGTLNRLLLPFGLHHILNSIVWFMLGDFQSSTGQVVHGELNRFFAGDKTAGTFMAGFYPIMMFALPAACIAMIHMAHPSRRKAITGLLLGSALTSFITGVTEPIEFAFMFLAPALYIAHAILTGTSLVIANLLSIKDGFGFSAGLIDYLLCWGLATKPFLLIPLGLIYGALYYGLFVGVIKLFNLPTPGREPEKEEKETRQEQKSAKIESTAGKAKAVLAAIGGGGNILAIDSCITRLRLKLKNTALINEPLLKGLGAHGIVRMGTDAVQIVLGTQSELICEEMKKLQNKLFVMAPLSGKIIPLEQVPDEVFSQKMMGDGIAIDAQENISYAPVSGELIVLFPTYHAYGIRTPEGVEMLVHVGLNTVELNGEGFTAYKKQGDTVTAGEKIVSFDMDVCKKNNKSLISPVIITNMDAVKSIECIKTETARAVKDIIMEIILRI